MQRLSHNIYRKHAYRQCPSIVEEYGPNSPAEPLPDDQPFVGSLENAHCRIRPVQLSLLSAPSGTRVPFCSPLFISSKPVPDS